MLCKRSATRFNSAPGILLVGISAARSCSRGRASTIPRARRSPARARYLTEEIAARRALGLYVDGLRPPPPSKCLAESVLRRWLFPRAGGVVECAVRCAVAARRADDRCEEFAC
eukprot:6474552-Prymnesium_polylepis.1